MTNKMAVPRRPSSTGRRVAEVISGRVRPCGAGRTSAAIGAGRDGKLNDGTLTGSVPAGMGAAETIVFRVLTG